MFWFLFLIFENVFYGPQEESLGFSPNEENVLHECIFANFKETPIVVSNGAQVKFTIFSSSFVRSDVTNGGSIYANSAAFICNFHFVCISNCYACSEGGIMYIVTSTSNQPHKMKYMSILLCTSARNAFIFHQTPVESTPRIIHNTNISNCKADGVDSEGIMYFRNMKNEFKYLNVEGCMGRRGIYYQYHKESGTEGGVVEDSNFVNNEIYKDSGYGIIHLYGQDMTYRACYFLKNIHQSGSTIFTNWGFFLISSCIIDNTYKIAHGAYGEFTEVHNYETTTTKGPDYTFYATLECEAQLPYPRRSPTFASTPFITPYTTPYTTPFFKIPFKKYVLRLH